MHFFRSLLTLSSLTIVSRISGFLRDIFLASILGTGPLADAFFIAFRLPNFFRRLFAEGAMNAAFVPTFSYLLDRQGKEEAQACAEQVFSVLLFTLVSLVIVAELLLPSLMHVIAPGYQASSAIFGMTTELSRIIFPYIFFISLAALLTGILNAYNHFAVGAASPVLLNIFMIIALVVFPTTFVTPAHSLGWSILAAGALQLIWVYIAVRRLGIRIQLRLPQLTEHVRYILRILAPAAGGAGVIQINMLIGTAFLSFLPTGSISYISYADRLHQLPLSVVGVAVSTALLPLLSRQLALKENEHAFYTQNRALELSLLLTMPAAIGLLVLAEPLVSLLFEGKAFPHASVIATAHALQAFAVGLPAYVLVKVFSTTFFAHHDSKTPVRAAIMAVCANVLLNFLLISSLAHVGIALATSIASWLNAGWLFIKLRRSHAFAADDLFKKRLTVITLASICLAIILVAFLYACANLVAYNHPLRIPLLLGVITGSGLVYLSLTYYLKALDLKAFHRVSSPSPAANLASMADPNA